MANKAIFKTTAGRLAPKADTVNEAGGKAYAFAPEHALAQLAATGCMNSTFYASAETQVDTVLALANKVSPEFLAKTAVWSRREGQMKDMPALLCAVLSSRSGELFERVFPRVIDNGKMLRNFVQIVRSGVTGRKSFGTRPRRLIRQWFDGKTDAEIFRANTGQNPSLPDVIKMVHPKGGNPARNALYAYLIGKEHDAGALDPLVRDWEAFKADRSREAPDVPFEMLTALELSPADWKRLASNAPWQRTRMNLNTFARHGVLEEKAMVGLIAKRLADPENVATARAFPYQLLMAYLVTEGNAAIPGAIREALQDALDASLSNVPELEGQTYIFPDVSGSMQSSVTGTRAGSTTAVSCIQVAALVASAFLRRNRLATVIPFEVNTVSLPLNPRDSMMTNAVKLEKIGGGGTNCSAPLALLNRENKDGDLLIYVSDYESWVDSPRNQTATEMMCQWEIFKARNPKAKMVCIDLQPNITGQAKERADILNIGGFSDKVFDIIALFARGELGAAHWTGLIERIEI